jgi:hypothetical protein
MGLMYQQLMSNLIMWHRADFLLYMSSTNVRLYEALRISCMLHKLSAAGPRVAR